MSDAQAAAGTGTLPGPPQHCVPPKLGQHLSPALRTSLKDLQVPKLCVGKKTLILINMLLFFSRRMSGRLTQIIVFLNQLKMLKLATLPSRIILTLDGKLNLLTTNTHRKRF